MQIIYVFCALDRLTDEVTARTKGEGTGLTEIGK